MMSQSRQRFASLLTQAIRLIAALEDKSLEITQDELGHALGRANGSSIQYWRKGHVPADPSDVRLLAEALSRRDGLDEKSCRQFLGYADYPNPEKVIRDIFGRPSGKPPLPDPGQGAALELQPFVVGPPITEPCQFFGREQELKRIFNGWRRSPLHNVALVGSKRSGKTSLLHYVKNITQTPADQLRPGQRSDWLRQPEQYRWVAVDFQDPTLGYLETLLRHLLTGLDLPIPQPCDLSGFMDVMKQGLQQPTLILMDEIGAALASDELDLRFWWSLRSLVNHYAHGLLGFLLTAHQLPMAVAANNGKPSPFFNMFSTVEIGAFPENEARELIASSPLAFDATDVAWILAQSQGWPLLVQILCQVRLAALEEGNKSLEWQAEGLRQIAPFRALLSETS